MAVNSKGFGKRKDPIKRDQISCSQNNENLNSLSKEQLEGIAKEISTNQSKHLSKEELSTIARRLVNNNLWNEAIETYGVMYNLTGELKTKQARKELFEIAAKTAVEFKTTESLDYHCRFLGVEPKHAQALRNFAQVLRRIGDLKNAEYFARKVVELEPKSSLSYVTLSTLLSDQGNFSECLSMLQTAIKLNPNDSFALGNLASMYHIVKDLDNAVLCIKKSLSISPSNKILWLDGLTHFHRSCDYEWQTQINWWKLLEQMNPLSISACLLQILVHAEDDQGSLKFKAATKRWGMTASTEIKKRYSLDDLIKKSYAKRTLNHGNGRIRIGFISADFKEHSVARFIMPIYELAEKYNVELYSYSTQNFSDRKTDVFKRLSHKFEYIMHLNPEETANKVVSDELDVIFDITGFTSGSRTSYLALRLAPIQISWLGFPGTIGLPEMDYILVDQYSMPLGNRLINEKPLVTKGTNLCSTKMDDIKVTEILPCEKRGFITFGSLNNPYKFTQKTLDRWSEVMKKVQTSKLLLIRTEFKSFFVRKNILEYMKTKGINPERISFYDNQKENRNYLDCYNEIDICLDTYPITGGTTTLDSIWMGVPTVSLEGNNIHQRISSSILKHAGLSNLIAKTDKQFIEISTELALDKVYRKELRASLRERVLKSKLFDKELFMKDLVETIKLAMAA